MKVKLPPLDLLSGSENLDSLDITASRYPPIARFLPIFILFLLIGLLAACGPSDSGADNNDLNAAAQRIALDYQTSNDLAGARSALAELDVPNANQLLILVAETAISANDFINGDPLVRLALALGLTSSSVERYAQSRGLMPQLNQAANQAASQPAEAVQPAAEQSTGQTAEQSTEQTTEQTTEQAAEQPTSTPAPEDPTPTPEAATATPVPEPEVRTQSPMNVRGGPGTNYAVVGALNEGDVARITGKNAGGDWWKISLASGADGWVYGPLVTTSGDTGGIAIAEAPPAPPTATPAPVQPTDTPVPAPAGVDFRLIEQRIWDVEENGGRLNGESVNCGDKQELHVIVLDAAGQRLNGVTVRGVYRNEYHVTGEKGPGMAQYDVNVDGDDIVVARDVDGRDVTSDLAKGLTAKTYNIPHSYLIQGRFCKDAASCDSFINTNGCFGHFSWTVTFQRTY